LDIEVPDAFGQQPWLGIARGWHAFASDRLSVKRQGAEAFENSFGFHAATIAVIARMD